jgi:hypothetical protein
MNSKDLITQNIINDLEVYCNNEGCPWTGKLNDLVDHLKLCLFDISRMPEEMKRIFNKADNKIERKIFDPDAEEKSSFNTNASLRQRLYSKDPKLLQSIKNNTQPNKKRETLYDMLESLGNNDKEDEEGEESLSRQKSNLTSTLDESEQIFKDQKIYFLNEEDKSSSILYEIEFKGEFKNVQWDTLEEGKLKPIKIQLNDKGIQKFKINISSFQETPLEESKESCSFKDALIRSIKGKANRQNLTLENDNIRNIKERAKVEPVKLNSILKVSEKEVFEEKMAIALSMKSFEEEKQVMFSSNKEKEYVFPESECWRP